MPNVWEIVHVTIELMLRLVSLEHVEIKHCLFYTYRRFNEISYHFFIDIISSQMLNETIDNAMIHCLTWSRMGEIDNVIPGVSKKKNSPSFTVISSISLCDFLFV